MNVSVPDYGELILNSHADFIASTDIVSGFRPRLRGTNLKQQMKLETKIAKVNVSVPDYGELILNNHNMINSVLKGILIGVSVPDYGELILNFLRPYP